MPNNVALVNTLCTVPGTFNGIHMEMYCSGPTIPTSSSILTSSSFSITTQSSTTFSTAPQSTNISAITFSTSAPSTASISATTSTGFSSPSSTTNSVSRTSAITSPPLTMSLSSSITAISSPQPSTRSPMTSAVDTTSTNTTGSVSSGASSSQAYVTPQMSSKTPAFSTWFSTFGTPATSVGTNTTMMVITNFQLWIEQVSQNLLDSGGLDTIHSLWMYTTSSSVGFLPSDVTLVLYILGNITKNAELAGLQFSVDTVQKVLVIVDHLNSALSSQPAASLENSVGPQMLRCLESFFSLTSVTYKSFTLFFKHFDFYCSVSSCEDLGENGDMQLGTGSLLSLHDNDIEFPPGCYVNVLSMTYKPPNNIFTSQHDKDGKTLNSFYLASAIQTHVLTLNGRSYHMANITMTFMCGNNSCDHTAVCVFWDFHLGNWSSNGCVTQTTNGSTTCFCTHLTSFSILMSSSASIGKLDSVILDCITEVGLSFSILALIFCITIQIILLRRTHNRMASHRYWTILHMSVFLLISNISFLASSYIHPVIQEKLCDAFTFCTHLALMAFFCWTLVQGVFLVCRLVFVFHHVTIREFIVLSVLLGYICPLVIAVSTFLRYFPHNYRSEDACWLKGPSGASLAFTIPTIVIMVANFLVLIVVIHKLMRPSISEAKDEDEEVIKKLAKAVVFYIPQYGLTWAVGVPLLANKNAIWLHYAFDILNPLQGVFLLLFGCFLDKKVMNLLRKRFLKNKATGSIGTTLNTYG